MQRQIKTSFKRYEKKFFLTKKQYEMFKNIISPYVKPDDYGSYTICNIYYDTDNYSLIRASLEKPVYKEKLRVRSYGVPGADDKVFVELKKKYDGVVYKRRVTMPEKHAADFLKSKTDGGFGQIGKEIGYFQSFYNSEPKVFIAYDREALQGREDAELRITFDTNLRYRLDRLSLSDGDDGMPLTDGGLILMEIKIADACPLWLSRALSECKTAPASFSKYGTCYKNHILKKDPEVTKKEMLLSA